MVICLLNHPSYNDDLCHDDSFSDISHLKKVKYYFFFVIKIINILRVFIIWLEEVDLFTG